MSAITTVSSIKVPLLLELNSTPLETTLEGALNESNRVLGNGTIEFLIKKRPGISVYLRRITRPNVKGHNLFYLKRLGFGYVYINQLMVNGVSMPDQNNLWEYIGICQCKSKEVYSAIGFKNMGSTCDIDFDNPLNLEGFTIKKWEWDAKKNLSSRGVKIKRKGPRLLVATVNFGIGEFVRELKFLSFCRL